MGYPYGKKGWRLYNLETHEFFVSRDVQFYETEFPFASRPNDDLVLPSNFEDPSIDFEDCDGLGVKGRVGRQVDHVEPSAVTAQPADGEALPIPDTGSQEYIGQDRTVISKEELIGPWSQTEKDFHFIT